MKTFTLSGFFSFLRVGNLVFEDNGKSGFKLGFSNNSLKDVDSNYSSGGRGIIGLILLFILFLCSNFLTAQTVQIDGLSTSFPGEWNQVGITHVPDKYNLINQDDIFAGNEKDFFYASNWFWKLGTAKDKNDIANAAAAILDYGQVKLADGSNAIGGPFLVFAGDRISNSGDAQIGFWFFQDGTHPETVNGVNLFTPEKHLPPTIGDILVLADFTGGGRDGAITVLEWVGTGGNYSGNSAFNQVAISAAVAENNGGATIVPVGWDFKDKDNKDSNTNTTQYGTNEFYEGYVNLAAFGSGAACFSRFQLETRSSQEITAVLDDFVGGALGGRPSATLAVVNPQCNGEKGCVTITSATAGLTFSLDGGAFTAYPSGGWCELNSGQHCVIAKNSNGCTSESICIIIADSPPIVTLGLDKTDVLCFGDSNGKVTATFSGGTGAYMVKIDAGAYASATSPKEFTGLAAGSHTVWVKDANGCEKSAQITVGTPTVVALGLDKTDVLCFGDSNGKVTATFSGGTGAYMVKIDAGAYASATSPKEFTGLAAGSHTVWVKDANGCEKSAQITVGTPTVVALGLDKTDVLCFGDSNGKVTATFSGGTGAYMVKIDAGAYASATSPKEFTGLAAGSHTVWVKDANGCEKSAQITVGTPTVVALGLDKTDVLCFGDSNGKVTATFSGGTGAYMVKIDAGAYASATSPKEFTGLAAGSHTVWVKDANGCEKSAQITVGTPTVVALGLDKTDVLCFGDSNGKVTATFSGGTGAYMVKIDAGAYASATSPKEFTGLAAGSHTVWVKDANGCEKSAQITVGTPTVVALGLDKTDVLCFGDSNGKVTATFSGGTGAYMVKIDAGAYASATSPKEFTGLAAGSHTVWVKDANGCEKSAQITVGTPTVVALGLDKTDVLCFGDSNGKVTATFSGGTGAYMVKIDAGAYASATSPKEFTGLAAGSHTVWVKDANGCEKSAQITVGTPTVVALGLDKTDVLCFGDSNGKVTATFSGGTGAYMVKIDAGAYASATSPKEFTGLAAGSHTVWVKDANGCEKSAQITVGTPTVVALGLDKTDVLCFGDSNGKVTATFSGGTGAYMVKIDAGAYASATSPKEFTGLAAGSHTVWVKDANGCEKSAQITVGTPAVIVADDTHTDANCNEGKDGTVTLTFSGGTPPYQVNFNNGGFVAQTSPKTYSELAAGTFTWVVKDANNCEFSGSETVGFIPCDAHCTYTQGYYGNVGGMSCADGIPYSTKGLIAKALSSYPDHKMVVGKDGNSVWMTDSTADIDKIIEVLPGGGSSYALSLGSNKEITALPPSYLKKGNINNTLLAQTITLGLNLGIDGTLGNFVLHSGKLATAAPQGGCGSKIPMPRSCSYDVYTPTINEYKYFDIPAFVEGITVHDLYVMANNALGGGTLPSGVSMASLANAVDVINNAFDGCRISMGYDQTPLTCIEDRAAFIVHPVPVVDYATITYKFSYASPVTIEVRSLSANGDLVHTQTDPTPSYLDKEVLVDFNFNTGTPQIYFIKIITNIGQSQREILSH